MLCMSRLPSLKSKEVVKILGKLGYKPFRQRGSHLILVNENDKVHQPTVPIHNKALKKGALKSIIRQMGLTVEEFERVRLES